MKPERLPDLLLAVLAVTVVSFAVSSTGADADLWGHVRFGLDIITSLGIPREDPYSFTTDRLWINHEWLAEAIMAAAYAVGESAGLIVLKTVLALAALAVLWRTLMRAGVFQPVAVALLLLGTLTAGYLLMSLRPQLFSVALFVVLLGLLNAASRGRLVVLLWLPVLFAVWANLHGGWIVGGGVLLLWSAGALVARAIPWPWLAGGGILAILGTLVTPYGPALWRFLWTTVGLGRADIVEWQALHRTPFLLLPWVMTTGLTVLAWRRSKGIGVAQFLPVFVLGVLALRVARLEGFFALAALILLAPCFSAFGPRQLPLSRRPKQLEVVAVAAICGIALVATGVAVMRKATCITIGTPGSNKSWAPEAEAMRFLQLNQLQGRLVSWFDYGQVAIWYGAPALRVSFDGRRETVYSDAVRRDHLEFYFNPRDASYARQLEADYVWLPRKLVVNDALTRDGWTAVFKGSQSTIYAKQAGAF